MNLENELANNLGELNSKDIDKKSVVAEEVRNSSAKSTKNDSFFKKHTSKIVFFAILAVIIWWKYFNNPNPPQKQQVVQNTASAVEIKEEAKQPSSQSVEKPIQNTGAVINENAVVDSNVSVATKVEPIEQWQSHIEYLFLNKDSLLNLAIVFKYVNNTFSRSWGRTWSNKSL